MAVGAEQRHSRVAADCIAGAVHCMRGAGVHWALLRMPRQSHSRVLPAPVSPFRILRRTGPRRSNHN